MTYTSIVYSQLAETYPDIGQARAMLEFLSSHSLLVSGTGTSTEQPAAVAYNLVPSECVWALSQLTPFIKALEEDRTEGNTWQLLVSLLFIVVSVRSAGCSTRHE